MDSLIETIRKDKHVFKKDLSPRLLCDIIDQAIHSPAYLHRSRYEGISIQDYSDLNMLESADLSQILIGLATTDPKQSARNKKKFYEKIAPASLIIGDHTYTSTCLMDGFMGKNKEDLDIMATIGHAQNGHCMFRGHGKYPNTTFDTVLDALLKNSKKMTDSEIMDFPARCQEDIDDHVNQMLFSFFRDRIPHRKLLNSKGQPLGRLNFLNGFNAYSLSLLVGWAFTGAMDSEKTRDKVEEKYGHRMGRGSTYAVDRELLATLGIDLDELARKEYSYDFLNHIEPKKLIETFRKTGIIVSKPAGELDHRMSWEEAKTEFSAPKGKDIIQAYIRTVKGKGVADDIAIFLSAYLIPSHKNVFKMIDGNFHPYYTNNPSELMSQLIGGSGADRVDTKEKYTNLIIEGGQDSLSARLAQAKYAQLCRDASFRSDHDIPAAKEHVILDEDSIIDNTLASAKMKYDIHSSARYFLKGHEIKEKMQANVKDGELTCTKNEIFRLAAEIAEYLHIPCDSLYVGRGTVPSDMTVGFNQIPLETVLDEMKERLGIVIDPLLRQKRLRDFVRAGTRENYK